jgi:hypothetical protein
VTFIAARCGATVALPRLYCWAPRCSVSVAASYCCIEGHIQLRQAGGAARWLVVNVVTVGAITVLSAVCRITISVITTYRANITWFLSSADVYCISAVLPLNNTLACCFCVGLCQLVFYKLLAISAWRSYVMTLAIFNAVQLRMQRQYYSTVKWDDMTYTQYSLMWPLNRLQHAVLLF